MQSKAYLQLQKLRRVDRSRSISEVRYRNESEQSSSWLIPIGNAPSGWRRSGMRCTVDRRHHTPPHRLPRNNCVKVLRMFPRRRPPGRPQRVFPIRQTFKSKCRIMLLLARRVSHHNLRDPHTSRCRRYRSHTHPRLPGRRLSKLLRARPRASTTRPRTAHPTHRVTGRRITRRRANRTTTIESPASLHGMLPVDREPNE